MLGLVFLEIASANGMLCFMWRVMHHVFASSFTEAEVVVKPGYIPPDFITSLSALLMGVRVSRAHFLRFICMFVRAWTSLRGTMTVALIPRLTSIYLTNTDTCFYRTNTTNACLI